jgi:ABC-2 type transport system permease protein
VEVDLDLIMMFIIIYGNMVMRSVIEEKTNRIIEIISSVKPFQLMIGKLSEPHWQESSVFYMAVIGLSLMFAASCFGVNVGPTARVSPVMDQAQHELSGTAQMYIKSCGTPNCEYIDRFCSLFHWRILSIQFFYAAIGAAVDNQTDSQQFLLPIIMPLMLSVYVGFLV